MMSRSSSGGMRNSDGEKSPTVRLRISFPLATATRTSLEILRISEPVSPRASAERSLVVGRLRRNFTSAQLHEARDDLDVEDPAREERCREDAAHGVVHAEEFRAALSVVNGEAERRRDERGADAADVVARRAAADVAAEE